MLGEAHLSSQRAASDAEVLLRKGESDAARASYVTAAQHEVVALQATSIDEPRTRGILAVSSVSLFYKGGDLDQAEVQAHSLLGRRDLPEFARTQLRELLGVIWEERALQGMGRQYSGETVLISVRGNEVGVGRAPVPLVVQHIEGIQSLLYRITEWLDDIPFRTKGAPSERVRELCQPWVSEPQAGSYRFSVRFVQPTQLRLFTGVTEYEAVKEAISPTQITDWLFRLIRAISPSAATLEEPNQVDQLIPDKQYKQALLKLARNIVPDGHRVKEIEFATQRADVTERVLFHAGARYRIRDNLDVDEPIGLSGEVTGTLRAVHLDKGWLDVVKEDGQPQRCWIKGEVLDDVVGPMLNKKVLVWGGWTAKMGRFNLVDIELNPAAASH
jgi:hypothetical protein